MPMMVPQCNLEKRDHTRLDIHNVERDDSTRESDNITFLFSGGPAALVAPETSHLVLLFHPLQPTVIGCFHGKPITLPSVDDD